MTTSQISFIRAMLIFSEKPIRPRNSVLAHSSDHMALPSNLFMSNSSVSFFFRRQPKYHLFREVFPKDSACILIKLFFTKSCCFIFMAVGTTWRYLSHSYLLSICLPYCPPLHLPLLPSASSTLPPTLYFSYLYHSRINTWCIQGPCLVYKGPNTQQGWMKEYILTPKKPTSWSELFCLILFCTWHWSLILLCLPLIVLSLSSQALYLTLL